MNLKQIIYKIIRHKWEGKRLLIDDSELRKPIAYPVRIVNIDGVICCSDFGRLIPDKDDDNIPQVNGWVSFSDDFYGKSRA